MATILSAEVLFRTDYLVGSGTADTNVKKTDGGYTFDQGTWIDWTMPALE